MAAPVERFTSAASWDKSKEAWRDCNGETDSALEVDVRGIRLSAPISVGKSEKILGTGRSFWGGNLASCHSSNGVSSGWRWGRG